MKAKSLLYAVSAVFTALSCTREAEETSFIETGSKVELVAAWADEENSGSRTAIQADGTSIWWTTGEEINAFFGTVAAGKFTSTNTEPAEFATFSGTLNAFIGNIESVVQENACWAVYPYDAANTCDGESVTLTVSSEQVATEGTFADKFFPAVARANTFSLSFWNVCGGARFSVTQEGVQKVIFKSNDGSPMSGKVRVGFGDDDKPQILEILEPVDSVVVNAPEGGFVPGANYFAAMLPQTHTEGMVISLKSGLCSAQKDLSQSITIHRSTFGILDKVDEGLSYFNGSYVVPDMVDLGLSVKWASFNLGATKPEEYGDYFAWGETEPNTYGWSNYKWCNGSETTLTKYNYDGSRGVVDNNLDLDPEDDAAVQILGGQWRMPTKSEQDELRNTSNCNWKWTSLNGVGGWKISSKIAGFEDKYIFLPAAGSDNSYRGIYGYYWSSSISVFSSSHGHQISFGWYGNDGDWGHYPRINHFSIRPVYGIKVPVEGISIDTQEYSLKVGDASLQLKATVSPENASERAIVWRSSDESIVSVSHEGVVQGLKEGEATVSAMTVDGSYTATCEITVTPYTVIEPEMVDLGLSVKWASFNMGATKPEEYGDYFAWGETEPKADYSWQKYKWCNGSSPTLTKYNSDAAYGNVDNKYLLDSEDDAAVMHLGQSWRIPTLSEWKELGNPDNCSWAWTTLNGVRGMKITSKKSGFTDKWIFIPAGGHYNGTGRASAASEGFCLTSLRNIQSNAYSSYIMYFGSNGIRSWTTLHDRCHGRSLRAVFGERVAVTGLSFESKDIELQVGNNYHLSVNIYPENASEKTVIWSNTNSNIATISDDGEVCALSEGTVTITAITVDGGYAETCNITVKPYSIVEPELVDLGLSVKWASFNLGATKPEEFGGYYAWGETEPKVEYSVSTYALCAGTSNSLTKYCSDSNNGHNGFTDNKLLLDAEDDAATVVLGNKWHTPTDSEWLSLKNNCTWVWTTVNGVYGAKVSSKISGYTDNWIFLPAAGYRRNSIVNDAGSGGHYWSSSLYSVSPCNALGLSLYSNGVYWGDGIRYDGQSIRPVHVRDSHVSGVSLNETSLDVPIGQTVKLEVSITPSDAVDKSVTWSSSDNSVATVTDEGLITAIKKGVAVITVTTNDGNYQASCSINVIYPVPEAVDLGLSVKWASFNLGATKPEDYGDYFAWGETEPKEDYSWSTYKWCKGSKSTMTKYCNNSSYGYNGYTDNKTVLDPEDDAAAIALGGGWRMPTKAEQDELRNSCTWTWTSKNGVNGRLVTGVNGNSIFLPAAGYRYGTSLSNAGSYGYDWSPSLITDYPDYPDYAYRVYFSSDDVGWSGFSRCGGVSVRPVSE